MAGDTKYNAFDVDSSEFALGGYTADTTVATKGGSVSFVPIMVFLSSSGSVTWAVSYY